MMLTGSQNARDGVRLLTILRSGAIGLCVFVALFSIPSKVFSQLESPSASIPVTIRVDWNNTIGRSTPMSYGLDLFGALEGRAVDEKYRVNISYMAPGLVRYCSPGMVQDRSTPTGLVDVAKKQWDPEKVRTALSGEFECHPARMVSIAGWPKWMDKTGGGLLDRDQYQSYADFCASLVTLVNGKLHLDVKYWEVMSEKDIPYFANFHRDNGLGPLNDPNQRDHLDELADLYTMCAFAMKRADPVIEIGGPTAARGDIDALHERFYRRAGRFLDFYTFNMFATGDRGTPHAEIYDKAKDIGRCVRRRVDMISRVTPDHRIPVYLTQFNVNWDWRQNDARMTDNRSVVFDALVFVETVKAGGAGAVAWNDCDRSYGKLDAQENLRLGAQGFQLFAKYLTGEFVKTSSDDEGAVVAQAVRESLHSRKAILLINRSDRPRSVTFIGLSISTARRYQVCASGYSETPVAHTDKSIAVPESSIIVLVSDM